MFPAKCLHAAGACQREGLSRAFPLARGLRSQVADAPAAPALTCVLSKLSRPASTQGGTYSPYVLERGAGYS